MSATQEGVESSIHEALMAKLTPATESAEPVVAEEVTEELEAQATDEPEALEAEGVEESVEAEPSDVEAQEQEPSESIELSHIAEYLGADEDQFTVSDDGELFVRTKIDGQEGQAKFSDLLKSYQLEGHLNKQSTELAESKKALQSKLAEADEQLAQKVQQLESLSQIAYNDLLTDYNKINWEELRADDPAEYTAKQMDFQNRQTQIGNLYQQALDQREQLSATDTGVQQEKIAEESAKLLQAYPKWSDQSVLQKEWSEIGEYAVSQGMNPESYKNTIDSSLIVMMDKARQFDALQKESPNVTNRVRKAPKIAKPGSTASKVPSKDAEVNKLKAQLKRDGGGAALEKLLLGRM